MVQIKLIKSPIGLKPKARLTIRALGLTKMNKVRQVDNKKPSIQGMIDRVSAYIEVQEI